MSALTKIFIVLMLVCALVGSMVLVVAVKNQAPYKANAEAEHTALIAAQAALVAKTNQLDAVQAEKVQMAQDLRNATAASSQKIEQLNTDKGLANARADAAEAKIAGEGNKVSLLTAANESLSKQNGALQQELAAVRPENIKLTTQNAELSRANNEAVTQLHFAEKTIRSLQEEIARLGTATTPKGGAAGPAETGPVASLTVQTPSQINGKVTSVRPTPGRTLIELPLGARDGVRTGIKFMVSRNGAFIADAVVDTVTPDASVAHTENTKKGEAVKAGDIVTSGSAQ